MSSYSIHMAQHMILAAQLVPQYKPIGICNSYAVLQSIPCSPECKIVGLILLMMSKVPDNEDTIKFMLDTQQFIYTVDMFRATLQLLVETPENPFVAPANIHTIEAFMNRVGYQGVVDKVSAFFTKNLAQPWQTMFKVFNRCLTTRTSGHDQTKINILQKEGTIQYPRFKIKLIVADLMTKFPNIPKSIDEDYHSIRDDVLLVSVYTTGNVSVRGMLILDALLTAEIRETGDFKEYETVFMKVVVLMNQPQLVVSAQGTNWNTPKAPRTPIIFTSPQESKKRKQTAGESSSRRIIIKKKKQNTLSIPPPGDDRERDEMVKATVLKHEEIDKLVDGDEDEESYASAFADFVINNDVDDTGSKLEPGSHKEHPKHVFDDDENKKKDEEVEKEKEVSLLIYGYPDIRNEQSKTPIPSPIRSPRNVSFSEKTTTEYFTDNISPTTATTSKTSVTPKQKKRSFTLKTRSLPRSIAGMCRRRGLIRSHIKTKFITREFCVENIQEVIQHYDKIVPELTVIKTNEMLKKEMPRLVKLAVNKDREVSPVDIYGMVSKEFVAHGPKLIEELFRKHMQNTTLNLYPKTNSSTANTSSTDLQQQLYLNMKTKPQDQAADPKIWEILKAKFEKP
ncbi:hypothetical protein Tco_0360231 [Tanacetum coccineum]